MILLGRPGAELLHEREEVGHAPVLGDLAVAHAHDIDGLELNLTARGCHAQEFSSVSPVIDSSLRDAKQDDSNNEVAPSRGGEQIDDVLDGLVGAVVGGFESAVWAMLRVRTVVEAAVGKWSAQPFVEEQK